MECSWKTRACLAPDAEKAFERQKRAGLAIVKTLCRIRRGSDQAFLGQEAEAKRLGHPADCQTGSFLTVGREKGGRRLRSKRAAPIGQGCGASRECGVGRMCGAIQAGVLASRGCGRAGGAGEPGVRASRRVRAGRAGGWGESGRSPGEPQVRAGRAGGGGPSRDADEPKDRAIPAGASAWPGVRDEDHARALRPTRCAGARLPGRARSSPRGSCRGSRAP